MMIWGSSQLCRAPQKPSPWASIQLYSLQHGIQDRTQNTKQMQQTVQHRTEKQQKNVKRGEMLQTLHDVVLNWPNALQCMEAKKPYGRTTPRSCRDEHASATPWETLAKPQTHCQADRLPKDCIVLAHWPAECWSLPILMTVTDKPSLFGFKCTNPSNLFIRFIKARMQLRIQPCYIMLKHMIYPYENVGGDEENDHDNCARCMWGFTLWGAASASIETQLSLWGTKCSLIIVIIVMVMITMTMFMTICVMIMIIYQSVYDFSMQTNKCNTKLLLLHCTDEMLHHTDNCI